MKIKILLLGVFFVKFAYGESINLIVDPYFDNGYAVVGTHDSDEKIHPALDADTIAEKIIEGVNRFPLMDTTLDPHWQLSPWLTSASAFEGANDESRCLKAPGKPCLATQLGTSVQKTCTGTVGAASCTWEATRVMDTIFSAGTDEYDVSEGPAEGVATLPIHQVSIIQPNDRSTTSSATFRLRSYAFNDYYNRPYNPYLSPDGLSGSGFPCGTSFPNTVDYENPNYGIIDCNPNDRNGTIYSGVNPVGIKETAGPHLGFGIGLIETDLSQFDQLVVHFKARLTYRNEPTTPEHDGHLHQALFRFGGYVGNSLTSAKAIAFGAVVANNNRVLYPDAGNTFCRRCQFAKEALEHDGEFLYTVTYNNDGLFSDNQPERIFLPLPQTACSLTYSPTATSPATTHWAKKRTYTYTENNEEKTLNAYVSPEDENCAFARDLTDDGVVDYDYLDTTVAGNDIGGLGAFYESICFYPKEVNQTQPDIADPVRNGVLDFIPTGQSSASVNDWTNNWNFMCGSDGSADGKQGTGALMFTMPAYKILTALDQDAVYNGIGNPLAMVNTNTGNPAVDGTLKNSESTYYAPLTQTIAAVDDTWNHPVSVDKSAVYMSGGPGFQANVDVDGNASDAAKYQEVEIEFDLLPYIQGLLNGSPSRYQWLYDDQQVLKWAYTRNLGDYEIGFFDIGWEIHELANIEVEVSDLNVEGVLKPGLPSASLVIPILF